MGIWYPLVWRILDLEKWWPPAKFIPSPEDSRVAVDIYLGICWLFEIVLCLFLFFSTCYYTYIATFAFFTFRIVDCSLVLVTELVKKAYRRPYEWATINRKVLLLLINVIELFILFAGVHYVREKFFLSNTELIGLESFMDAIYFSVVTGTTLGYGDLAPKIQDGWGQLLVIIQPVIILIFALNMVSFARSKNESAEPPHSQGRS